MKMMIAGAWRWPIYEEAFARGLIANGVEVSRFSTTPFFDGLLGKEQLVLPLRGPALVQLNRSLLEEAKHIQPDWILFWRPTHFLPSTLRTLTSQGFNLVSYNNDDPFGPRKHGNVPWHHHFLWRNYLACLSIFDKNFFYRQVNCDEALEYGARNVSVLLPYFIPWRDRRIKLTSEERKYYESDFVFVGHYEKDLRVDCIRSLHESGFKVKVWGGSHWSRNVLGSLYEELAPITSANGDEYIKIISSAKICLAFLSKLNRDTYTRRCFEIPACKSVMLAERTDDLMRLFKDDQEACFFSSTNELLEKAHWLINDDKRREAIGSLGESRVWADAHDVGSRASQFIDMLNA